jgi:hypothetical protein
MSLASAQSCRGPGGCGSRRILQEGRAKIEYHDGHRVVGEATETTWTLEGVKLEPGLHVLFAVGVKADGTRCASRPALAIVK